MIIITVVNGKVVSFLAPIAVLKYINQITFFINLLIYIYLTGCRTHHKSRFSKRGSCRKIGDDARAPFPSGKEMHRLTEMNSNLADVLNQRKKIERRRTEAVLTSMFRRETGATEQ